MQANTTDEELRYAGLPDSYRAHIVAFCARHSDSAKVVSSLGLQQVKLYNAARQETRHGRIGR